MRGKMPDKKPFGRREPPPNYPRDPDMYADPRNYMYPLDRPIRAKLARRYFDEPRNRIKYTEEERLFIDSRIDEALKRFGIPPNEAGTSLPQRTAKRRVPGAPSKEKIEKLDLDQLLKYFLSTARLERAKSIADNLVSLSSQGREVISGRVKQYSVHMDLKNKVIMHDCDDWKRNMKSKLMCKHLGKAFLSIQYSEAIAVLRQILSHRDDWTFKAP